MLYITHLSRIYHASITHLLSRFAPSPRDPIYNLPQPKGHKRVIDALTIYIQHYLYILFYFFL